MRFHEVLCSAPGFLYFGLAWVWDPARIKAAGGALPGIGGSVVVLGRHGGLLGSNLFSVVELIKINAGLIVEAVAADGKRWNNCSVHRMGSIC